MKRGLTVILAALLAAGTALGLAGCGGGDEEIVYPDFPETPGDKNSWEYTEGEDVTIDWFVNYSWFSYPNCGADVISREIKRRTGISVNFTSPVDESGEMLNLMIAGDTLPDVISVQAYTPKATQLAMEHYVYPVDELAKRWAPSLLGRIEDDIRAYYQLADGHIYGLPSEAYSSKYVSEEDKWAPNGGIVVRKDWLEWYQAQPNAMDVGTKAGLLDAMEKVTAQFKTSSFTPVGLLLDSFNEEGNNGVTWLSQYFAAPFEDKQGNYIDQRTTPQYKEAVLFLNECYRRGFMRRSNISASADEIGSVISKGEPFVCALTPQNYMANFIAAYQGSRTEYVPIVLRNDAGEDPVLQDLTGMGFLYSMVTTSAERPDLIIKLFDFLYSEEGQLLCKYGIEGQTWEWEDEAHTRVKVLPAYLDAVRSGTEDAYGFGRFNVLHNSAFILPRQPLEGKTVSAAYVDNIKRPLTPFSHRYTIAWPRLDVASDNYFDIVQKETSVQAVWAEFLPDIIDERDAASASEKFDDGITALNRRGLAEVTAAYAERYALNKQAQGVTWGWPLNDPNYRSPTLRNPDGSFSDTPVGVTGDPWYYIAYIVT